MRGLFYFGQNKNLLENQKNFLNNCIKVEEIKIR